MLRSSSATSNSSYSEKPLSRRHPLEEGQIPAQRRRSLSGMLGVRARYRVAYTILTACAIYLFVVAVERRLSVDAVPPFESFGGEVFGESGRGRTPMAAKARAAEKQAVLASGGGRVPLPAAGEGPSHKVKDGFLRVDMDARVHPIMQLVRDARRKWDAKTAKQSRTLRDAVDEYQSRYMQHPPKGFDKWWRYVVYVPSPRRR